MKSAEQERGTVGYVPGGWDMFHVGHLNILKRAKQECDYLIVGVASDDALLEMKGRRPIVPLAERLAIVEAIGVVDEAVVDFSRSKVQAWQRIRFDVLFKGDDWKGSPKGDQLEREMAAVSVSVFYLPYTHTTSSTALRRALLAL